MIFKIIKGEDFFESNPSATNFEEFMALTSEEMKYTCLMYDYQTPFRNIPMKERPWKILGRLDFPKTKAGKYTADVMRMVYQDEKKYRLATAALRDQMFDDELADRQAYKSQLEELREFLKKKDKSAQELGKIKLVREEMKGLRSDIEEIDSNVLLREEKEVITNETEDFGTIDASLVELMNDEDFRSNE